MYVWMKLKYLWNWKLIFLFVIGLLLSIMFLWIRESRLSLQELRIEIVDLDNSEVSKKWIELLKKSETVNVQEKGDLVFELKKGFSENLLRGDLKGLILLKKGKFTPYLSLIKDKLAGETVKLFIYYDLYQRYIKRKPLDFNAYEESLRSTKKENEIFGLDIILIDENKVSKEFMKEGIEEKESYFQFVLLAFMGFILQYFAFQKLVKERENGLRERLSLLGVRSKHFVFSAFIESHLRYLCYLFGFFIFSNRLGVSLILLVFFVFEISFILLFLVERYWKEELFLRAFFPIVSGLLLSLGLGLLFFY